MSFSRRTLLALLLFTAGCTDTTRTAMGDVNSIIVVAADSLWAEVSDTVLQTLQPEIFAVRDENTFNLTHVPPGGPHWSEFQRFRQLLVIGRPDDFWVEETLDAADTTVTGGAIVEASRVWARNQQVTAVVVPETDPAAYVRSAVDSLAALLDARYRQWAQSRMFISGRDTALVDTLREQGGFALEVPNVYRWRQLNDSTFAFLNDNPDASQLVRWVTVTWRQGTEGEQTPEEALRWRDSIAANLYDWGQEAVRDRLQTTQLPGPGAGGIEVRGAWTGLGDFPQGGPFIAQLIDCPEQNRRYLLDAWLYAPTRDKYQYMIQLETLLESFECGG